LTPYRTWTQAGKTLKVKPSTDPAVIAADLVEDVKAALEQFAEIQADLKDDVRPFRSSSGIDSGVPYTETLGPDVFNNSRGHARPVGVDRKPA
jgi:hypothetical protein